MHEQLFFFILNRETNYKLKRRKIVPAASAATLQIREIHKLS